MTAYHDYTIGKGAGLGDSADLAVFLGTATGLPAGKGSISDVLTAGDDVVPGIGAGLGFVLGGLRLLESVTGMGAGKGTMSSGVARFKDSVPGAGAGLGHVTTVLTNYPTVLGKGAGRGNTVDVLTAVDAPVGLPAGKGTLGSAAAYVSSSAGAWAGKGTETGHAMFVDTTLGAGAGLGNLQADVGISGLQTLVGGGAGAGSSPNTLTAHARAAGLGAGLGSACVILPFDWNDLIRAVRYNCKLALPEVSKFPEALSEATNFDELTLPFLAIVVGDPRADQNWAVNDYAQWVPIDFVYVSRDTADSGTDTAKDVVRPRLSAALHQMVVQDYHESNILNDNVSTQTELMQAPYAKHQRYNDLLRDKGQPATAMVLSMEFLVIYSRVC